MDRPYRVVLADDHPLFLSGLRGALELFGNYKVVAERENAESAVEAVLEHHPDIILLDVNMPGKGIEAARRISEVCPTVRIVMLTGSDSDSDVKEALQAGASAYVLKGIGGVQLGEIVETVLGGGSYISPNLASQILIDFKAGIQSKGASIFAQLSDRELDVVEQLVLGRTNREIAAMLDLNENTIERDMTNIMRILGVKSRLEAALKANMHFAEKQTNTDA